MTPLQIEILLHYHTRVDDYREGDFRAPAVRGAIDEFRSLGILVNDEAAKKPYPRTYKLSPAGHMYVQTICEVPLPHREWVLRWKGTDRHSTDFDYPPEQAEETGPGNYITDYAKD